MPQEGVGVALGAQVGHLVTYRDPNPWYVKRKFW